MQRNLTGSKISTSSTKFVFFPRVDRISNMATLVSDWPRHFSTFCLEKLNRIQRILTERKISMGFLAHLSRRLEWAIVIAHRPSSGVNFHIFDFSSETAEQNSTKLDRNQDLNALYQVCVFWANRKNKMAALASDWLRHFRLLLWTGWTEFNETWQEARSQRPLPSLCFSGRSEKQDGRPGLWLAETFSTSSLKPLNGIQRNLTESKISTPSTKFVFFGPIGKTRWPPWPLIGWDIFDFSSETAERNSTKLDRKQDLNALYQVCVFWADWKNMMAALASDWLRHFDFFSETAEWNSTKLDREQDLNFLYQFCVQEARSQRPLPSLCFWANRKNKMAALASDWLRHFRLLLWTGWTEFNETWQEARSQRPLPNLCFSGRSEKQDGRPGLWLAETFSTSSLKPLNGIQRNLTGSKISTPSTKCVFFGPIGKTRWPPWPLIGGYIFDFSSETAERNSTKLDRKQDLKALYQVCVLQVDQKNKMATPGSDWRRHVRLFLWNPWMEFNETWQEARSQLPLPGLRFSGRSEKRDSPPGLLFAETFSTSLKQLNGIQRNLTESKFSTSSTKFVFFGLMEKTIWPRWPLIDWDIFWLFLWNRWTEFSETWHEVRSQRPLPSLCFSGRKVNKKATLANLSKKVAHCTQVHVMWPFGPLVFHSEVKFLTRSLYSGDRQWPFGPLVFFFFYQVCVFRANQKIKMAALTSNWLRHFWFLLWNRWTEFDRKQDLKVIYQVCVGLIGKDGRPGL